MKFTPLARADPLAQADDLYYSRRRSSAAGQRGGGEGKGREGKGRRGEEAEPGAEIQRGVRSINQRGDY